ncbi:aldehyde dehydrogenase family protein [Micromonospora radicis]|uniref:Aldehyde dehydrogenase family protein n=1 Tax=Micromonospora radicis TaxID=1894971 RepID=A0A418MP42_9ACTN|nr:aldehyde dehydrogenase family protein [Micromonospora radicis]RIV34326.1 aldehyde dehydrogenase family protein [Micromonospora radicis]
MSTETVNTSATRDGDPSVDGEELVTRDQTTGRELARHRVAGPEQVRAAVEVARTAAGPWWDLGFDGRAERLRAWRRDIAQGGEELATLIRAENGKSLEDGRAEVLSVLGHLTFVLDNVERVLARHQVATPPAMTNQRASVEYLPYGVVGVIGPWNFPLGTPGAIVIHALAAGNVVILKPSPITPGVGEWLARSWRRAVPDLPDTLQTLVGFAATGQALTADVDKIAFTGSVRSGRAVAADCARRLTPMLLELGGNDAAVVAEDADLDDAAAHITWGALQNAGFGCISLEVAYVVDAVHDALVDRIAALARRVHAGSGDDDLIGPVPLPAQIPVIRHHIEDALARGATAVVGGPASGAADDQYVQPTILVDVPADALAAVEETFGPVLSIIRVADTEEAIARINASPYGLGSAVFSRDHGEAIARRLRVGMTSVNDALAFSQISGLPFGGRGDSGFGRKHGDEGLLEFVYPHAITVRTGPAPTPTTTFARPPGAMAHALAVARARLLGEDDHKERT